jgi:alpha-L-rhamnosidase
MITTGFLGTPLILHALSKNGHLEAAYAMLLRTDFRSWLYAVDRGATTMWERWDAIRHDGTIHTGAMDTNPEGQDDASMISFNHYAYGAVVDWMYRNVAGISGDHGFRKITVQPTIAQGMTYAKGMVESRYGTAAVEWQLQDSGVLEVVIKVPFGVTAELVLPKSSSSSVVPTEYWLPIQASFPSKQTKNPLPVLRERVFVVLCCLSLDRTCRHTGHDSLVEDCEDDDHRNGD